jgi:hypothetical protein
MPSTRGFIAPHHVVAATMASVEAQSFGETVIPEHTVVSLYLVGQDSTVVYAFDSEEHEADALKLVQEIYAFQASGQTGLIAVNIPRPEPMAVVPELPTLSAE